MPQFIKDVQDLRRRAEEKMEDGAVTQSYRGDVNKTIDILNEALATEIVCVLRYMHHYFMATGVHGKSVVRAFASLLVRPLWQDRIYRGRRADMSSSLAWLPLKFCCLLPCSTNRPNFSAWLL